MRSLALFCVLLLIPVKDNRLGNPRYDFPEVVIARDAKRYSAPAASREAVMNGLAISGYYHESRRWEDTLVRAKKLVRLTLTHKRIIDAREFILAETKKYRVLLINESHIRPQHRFFTKSLLKELHAQGYNVLMAEGIWQDNTIDDKGYPVSSDGALLNEPGYASLLRYAGRSGYKVRAYDFSDEKKARYWDDSIKLDKYGSVKYISYQPKDSATILYDEKGLKMTIFTSVRERDQANHIYQVIKDNPHSKFIIHVGMGHLYESGPMMGAHLRQLLNQEDLLTISQVELDDRATVIDTLANDTVKRDFSYLLWDSTRNRHYHFYNGAQVDYTIFNEEVKDSLSRPSFLFKDVEERVVYQLPDTQTADCPCLFSAYYQEEYRKEGPQAIAADLVYIRKEQPPLLLPRGQYTVVKKNGLGEYSSFDILVK